MAVTRSLRWLLSVRRPKADSFTLTGPEAPPASVNHAVPSVNLRPRRTTSTAPKPTHGPVAQVAVIPGTVSAPVADTRVVFASAGAAVAVGCGCVDGVSASSDVVDGSTVVAVGVGFDTSVAKGSCTNSEPSSSDCSISFCCTSAVARLTTPNVPSSNPTAAPPSWTQHVAEGFGPIPGGLVLIAIPVVVWILLQRLPYHRVLLSVGGNDATAFSAGINVTVVRIVAYTLGGVFAAVAGIAIATLLQSSDGNAGLEYVLIALAAVALGGTPIGGGRGGLLGAIVGAAAIFLIQNLLSALHVDAYWLQVAYGAMLIVGCVIGLKTTS